MNRGTAVRASEKLWIVARPISGPFRQNSHQHRSGKSDDGADDRTDHQKELAPRRVIGPAHDWMVEESSHYDMAS